MTKNQLLSYFLKENAIDWSLIRFPLLIQNLMSSLFSLWAFYNKGKGIEAQRKRKEGRQIPRIKM